MSAYFFFFSTCSPYSHAQFAPLVHFAAAAAVVVVVVVVVVAVMVNVLVVRHTPADAYAYLCSNFFFIFLFSEVQLALLISPIGYLGHFCISKHVTVYLRKNRIGDIYFFKSILSAYCLYFLSVSLYVFHRTIPVFSRRR